MDLHRIGDAMGDKINNNWFDGNRQFIYVSECEWECECVCECLM